MEIVNFTEDGVKVEHRDYLPFGTAALADYLNDHPGDMPLLISSHGERYGIDGFSYDPNMDAVTLTGSCKQDNTFVINVMAGGDARSAAAQHREGEKLARHLEEVAAGIRAKYPPPGALPPGGPR